MDVRRLTGLSSERHDLTERLPLFAGEPEPIVKPLDPEARLEWARRAILLSNLETFGAEDVRRCVDEMRPELLGAGLWLGFTFRHQWFAVVGHEHAQRPEAKGRWVLRYKLSDAGRNARRDAQRGIHV